jgi:hypothetical protein
MTSRASSSLDLSDEAIRQAIIARELRMMSQEYSDLQKPRSYYDGEQTLVYATEKFIEQFGTQFKGFRDNWMRVVIDTMTDKMELQGIHIGPPGERDPNLSSLLWSQFLRNDIDELQSDIWEGATIEGHTSLIIWPDGKGGVKIDWNPAQLVRVRYSDDDPKVPAYATKRWITPDGSTFVTFYTPTAIYKYVEKEGRGEAQQSDQVKSPLDTVPETGSTNILTPRSDDYILANPLKRVPVIEFPNKNWRSELIDHMPQQDAVNYILQQQMVAAEFGAFKQRVVITSQAEPTGGWKASPGYIWALKPIFNPDGTVTIPQFGSFDATDPASYTQIVNMYLQHMALTSKTPVRAFFESDRGGRGDAASGESLKVEDKPLNDKVMRRQRILGNRAYTAIRLISDILPDTPAFDDLPIGEPIWKDPRAEYRMALLEEALKLKELGLPRKYIFKHLGLTQEEQDEVEKWIEEDQQEALEQQEEQAAMMAEQEANMPNETPSASGPGPSSTPRA